MGWNWWWTSGRLAAEARHIRATDRARSGGSEFELRLAETSVELDRAKRFVALAESLDRVPQDSACADLIAQVRTSLNKYALSVGLDPKDRFHESFRLTGYLDWKESKWKTKPESPSKEELLAIKMRLLSAIWSLLDWDDTTVSQELREVAVNLVQI
jgi:hypothetical protein